MKMRNKGKVYPSSSSSSSSSSSPVTGDSLSILNLLPAAILTLAVVLSVEDREVLAYMITRSIKSTNPSSSSSSSAADNKKKAPATHKPPVFDCDCFDCYTSYWFKWDTSPNRELIHQAIEAFEENLTSTEQLKKKGKKSHRRLTGKTLQPEYDVALVEPKVEECNVEENQGEVLKAPAEEPPERFAPATVKKVAPDVKGLFNWRFWNIWSPNE